MAACLTVTADYETHDPRYALLRLGFEFQLKCEGTIVSKALSASLQKDESGIQIPWEATANRDLIEEELRHTAFCRFPELYGLDPSL